jgi:hypothetical protein
VGARDIARNCESEAGAAFILVTRIVEPQERLEHFFAQTCRNTRPVVVNRDREITVIAVPGDRDRRCVACGVRDQVGETPFECRRP